MKKLILFILLIIPISLQAQTKHQLNLSLKQAIQLGLKNRYDLKAKHTNINLAKNQVSKNKKAWIPDIHAEGSVQYNAQLKPTYVPKGFGGMTESGMLALGAKNMTVFGLSLNQPLFKPGITTDVKIAKARLALQKEKLRGSKIDIKQTIAKAYLNVLLKQLQVQIAQDEEARFGKYKTLAQGKYSHGALIKNKYLQAKLDYKNAKVKTATLKQNYKLSLLHLKHQINVPERATLILSDSIGHVSFGRTMPRQSRFAGHRSVIKQLKLKKQENTLQIKRARQNALPTVSLFGYYAQMYQNNNFRYNESKWWAPHSYAGVKINIPITGNFSNKNKIQKQKLQKHQLEMTLQQNRSDVRYQIQKASTDLQNSQDNMQSAKRNYELAQSIYRNQQKQFAIGVFKYTDLLDTEKSLEKAEQSYIQTVYDYLVAKVEYKKSIGWQ